MRNMRTVVQGRTPLLRPRQPRLDARGAVGGRPRLVGALPSVVLDRSEGAAREVLVLDPRLHQDLLHARPVCAQQQRFDSRWTSIRANV